MTAQVKPHCWLGNPRVVHLLELTLGIGEGLGLGDGEGLGVGDGDGEGEGLGCGDGEGLGGRGDGEGLGEGLGGLGLGDGDGGGGLGGPYSTMYCKGTRQEFKACGLACWAYCTVHSTQGFAHAWREYTAQ